MDLAYLALDSDGLKAAAEARRFFAAIRERAFGSLIFYRIERTRSGYDYGQRLLGVIQDVRRSLN